MTHEEIRVALSSGCSEDEMKAMRCPICNDEVRFNVRPNRKDCFICCKTSTKHMAMHEECKSSPLWWEKYVIHGGWLS